VAHPRGDAGRDARRELIVVAGLALLGLALRLTWIAYVDFAPSLNDDAGRYDFLGRSLAEGGGYNNPNGATTMFWPPGYPFILAAVYKLWPAALLGDHEVTAALALNALLGALTVVVTYGVTRRAFDGTAAVLAAAIVACFPSLIFLGGVTLTETTFTALLVVAVWLIVTARGRREVPLLALVALVLGFATLVRGVALLVPLVALLYWRGAHGDWRAGLVRATAVTVGALLVVAPWTVRNYVESGSFVLISSNAGVDFYIGHSDGADGRGRKVDELVFRYPGLPPAEAEARVSSDGFERGLRFAARHPLDEVTLSARKVWWLWYRDDEAVRWSDAHGERDVMPASLRAALVVASNAYYWPVLALAIIGVLTERWWRRPEAMLLASLIGYWTLVHVAFFGDARFHAPALPFVAAFAGAAISTLTPRLLHATPWRPDRREHDPERDERRGN
jgi:4-amino-4-deoxy-L-arabinose transferase-like glycosyltransferase